MPGKINVGVCGCVCVCVGGGEITSGTTNQPTNPRRKKQEGETKTEECRMCAAGKSSFNLYFLMAAAIRRTRSELAEPRLGMRDLVCLSWDEIAPNS